jgi:tetratricopeptide (TPR) repeat protein
MTRPLLLAWAFAVVGAACSPFRTPDEGLKSDLAAMSTERSVQKLAARGRGFASIGDTTRAEQYLSAALDAGGDPAELLPELLRVCVVAKRYRVAIDYAAPWLERSPRDAKLRFLVASLRATVGDVEGARADFDALIKQDPADAPAHFAYATLLHDQLGDFVRADAQFREYLRLDPNGSHSEAARARLLNVVQ